MKENRVYKLNPERIKEIIGILMESAFYFELNLRDRDKLIKQILCS